MAGTPLATQKATASTYATSTVALLDSYKQQFEQLKLYVTTCKVIIQLKHRLV